MPRAAGSRRGGDISTPRGRGRARAGRREKGRTDRKPSTGRRASCSRARGRVAFDDVGIGGGSGGRSVSVRSAGRSSWSYPLSSEGDIYKMPRPRRVPGHHWVSAADARRSSPRSRRLNARRVAPRPSRERVRPGDRHPVGGGRHLSEWRQDCQLYLLPTVRTMPSQGGDVHASPRRVAGVPTRPHRAHASTRRARTRRIARAGRPDGRRRRALERSGATAKAAGGEASQLAPRER